jgi:hypothetical protein
MGLGQRPRRRAGRLAADSGLVRLLAGRECVEHGPGLACAGKARGQLGRPARLDRPLLHGIVPRQTLVTAGMVRIAADAAQMGGQGRGAQAVDF